MKPSEMITIVKLGLIMLIFSFLIVPIYSAEKKFIDKVRVNSISQL